MKPVNHVDSLYLNAGLIANVKGFSVERANALTSFGLHQDSSPLMAGEFAGNMGFLCVWVAALLTPTLNQETNNWQFSQHGVLYDTRHLDAYPVETAGGLKVQLTHTEFSLCVALNAAQYNMVWGFNNRIYNPFAMSYFYFNYLLDMAEMHQDKNIILEQLGSVVISNTRKEYWEIEPFLENILNSRP